MKLDETGDWSLASRVEACQAKPNSIRIAAICIRSFEHWKKNGFYESLFALSHQSDYFRRKLVSVYEWEVFILEEQHLEFKRQISCPFPAMPCISVRQPLQRLFSEHSSSRPIPSFLVPSLVCRSSRKAFSTSRVSQSRIGGAAISVPPEVSLRFYDLPKSNVRSRKTDVPTLAVEVVGPLGGC
jgi:hypothetical protein